VKAAWGLLKQSTEYFSVRVCIDEQLQKIPTRKREPKSNAAFSYVVRVLDIYGAALLRLVTDLASQEAFELVMDDCFVSLWPQFSGSSIEGLGISVAFGEKTLQSKVDRFIRRLGHWKTNGYRRLAAMHAPNVPTTRRGYRMEVNAWMKRKGIDTITDAAKALGVSKSALKSIMSSTGQVRYGPDRLKDVLDKISR
jgi:hypothetical protein